MPLPAAEATHASGLGGAGHLPSAPGHSTRHAHNIVGESTPAGSFTQCKVVTGVPLRGHGGSGCTGCDHVVAGVYLEGADAHSVELAWPRLPPSWVARPSRQEL